MDIYPSVTDLRYNDKLKIYLSSKDLESFFDYKDTQVSTSDYFFNTSLVSFNSRHIFLCKHQCLSSLYSDYLDLINSNNIFSDMDEMIKSRIYSEVEGSLKIEGFHSTRRLFDSLMSGKEPENRNEIIIRNMGLGIKFVLSAPEFNEDNLFKLYTILSSDCLLDEQKLEGGSHYRNDMVFISNYSGCPHEKIAFCMKSLFDFVNKNLKDEDSFIRFLLPHIVHYYLVYIHPYFDYNGRTARMCSLWIASLLGLDSAPFFISEAINDTKKKYYNALSMTRDSRNDLTYFLKYILETSVNNALCYLKLEYFSQRLKDQGESFTPAEFTALKKILIFSENKYFSWKDFSSTLGNNISKQGALKILNRLEKLEILESKINSRKEKQFLLKGCFY